MVEEDAWEFTVSENTDDDDDVVVDVVDVVDNDSSRCRRFGINLERGCDHVW